MLVEKKNYHNDKRKRNRQRTHAATRIRHLFDSATCKRCRARKTEEIESRSQLQFMIFNHKRKKEKGMKEVFAPFYSMTSDPLSFSAVQMKESDSTGSTVFNRSLE